MMQMSKTIKQIADELGISKQKVYRFIKKEHINESHQENNVMYYDDTAQNLINNYFTKKECINESHQNHINETVNDTLIEMLKKELENKNKQISELQKLLDQQQQLQLQQQKSIPVMTEKLSLWNKIIKKRK